MSAIVDFLESRGPDAAGRTIDRVLAFGPRSLELHHDFIQWIFPLAEPSRAVPASPVLTPEDIHTIRGSPAAQYNLARARAHMIWFYETTDDWLRPKDHNHLRITRIIRSLRLLVGDQAADSFRRRIEARTAAGAAAIDPESLRLWSLA